jgi:DNA invertase Pin-like site-specific DNA recombinase
VTLTDRLLAAARRLADMDGPFTDWATVARGTPRGPQGRKTDSRSTVGGTMNVHAYVRVSSRAQDHATQRHAVERAAAARGDTVERWHVETMSGRTVARPVLDELRAAVRRGEVRRLYVYRLDRLTRSGIRDTLDVVHEVRAHGCELVTLADGFDPSGPAADLILAVMAWAAQMERQAINERISAARVRVEAQGGAWGRPSRYTPADVCRALEMRKAGHSVRDVAVALKIPRSTVARMLLTA